MCEQCKEEPIWEGHEFYELLRVCGQACALAAVRVMLEAMAKEDHCHVS
jgi:hypothetical protein